MLGKDSVKSRLDSRAGLSFTEFSYQLFQAHDFMHLFQHHACVMQVRSRVLPLVGHVGGELVGLTAIVSWRAVTA